MEKRVWVMPVVHDLRKCENLLRLIGSEGQIHQPSGSSSRFPSSVQVLVQCGSIFALGPCDLPIQFQVSKGYWCVCDPGPIALSLSSSQLPRGFLASPHKITIILTMSIFFCIIEYCFIVWVLTSSLTSLSSEWASKGSAAPLQLLFFHIVDLEKE